MQSNPVVSICCLTYNHKNFISQAIKSFLDQNFDYPFEIIIHDDASDDGTAEKVFNWSKKHREIIPIFQKENQRKKNEGPILTRFVFPKARGEYLAICDGDDYWIDNYKLKNQVRFLSKNPNFSGCVTNGKIFDEMKGEFVKESFNSNKIKRFQTSDLLNGNPFFLSTSVYRANIFKKNIKKLNRLNAGDYGLHLLASIHNDIMYFNDVTTVYRKHQGSEHTALPEEIRLKKTIFNAVAISKYVLNNKSQRQQFEKYIKRLIKRLSKVIKSQNYKFKTVRILIFVFITKIRKYLY